MTAIPVVNAAALGFDCFSAGCQKSKMKFQGYYIMRLINEHVILDVKAEIIIFLPFFSCKIPEIYLNFILYLHRKAKQQ